MARLPEEEQQGLTSAAGGSSGKDLLKFSGLIGQTDLQSMTKAIEEECKRSSL
jgi:hypothetical protein